MWAKQKRQSGFTIVELLIVIVVIGILAAITIVAFNGVQAKAQFARVQSDLNVMKKGLEMYKAENGNYPNTISNGNRGWYFSSSSGSNFIPGVSPAYIPNMPSANGLGGNAASYIYNSDGNDYKLMRYGSIPSNEFSQVPASMIDASGNSNKDRYGYWTAGAAGF